MFVRKHSQQQKINRQMGLEYFHPSILGVQQLVKYKVNQSVSVHKYLERVKMIKF